MAKMRRNFLDYYAAMAVARSMLKKGIITEKEYADIDTIIAKKHGISLCSILR